MPRPLKPRKRGNPRQEADPHPQLIEALSLAGVPRPRIAELLGITLAVLDDRYAGHLKPGPKMPAARIASLVRRLVEIAETAEGVHQIPELIAVVKLLAPLHLVELAKSQQAGHKMDDQQEPIEFVKGDPPAAT